MGKGSVSPAHVHQAVLTTTTISHYPITTQHQHLSSTIILLETVTWYVYISRSQAGTPCGLGA